MPKKLRVLVLCGGPSAEHEVSLKSAQMVLKNLDKKKYAPELCVIGKDWKWKIGKGAALVLENALREIRKFDFVFIAMHGAFGEDGRVQALLEWIGVPYGGSGVTSSATAMDKHLSSVLHLASAMRVPRYAVIDKSSLSEAADFVAPVIVKPVDGGSSVGISIIKSKNDILPAVQKALKENQRIILQEYIKGREFTCGVIEDKNGKPFALLPTEIIPRASSFFDYRAKYQIGGSEEVTPPRIPKPQIKELQKLALKAHLALGCAGMSRSDFILKGSTFYILETNTIPGMTETSLLPQAASAAGISFPKLLDMIIASGRRSKRV